MHLNEDGRHDPARLLVPVGVLDLLLHDAADRRLAEAVLLRALERLVEVRAGGALGTRAIEHVAGAALLDEELLARDDVGVVARAATACGEERDGQQGGQNAGTAHHGAELYPLMRR